MVLILQSLRSHWSKARATPDVYSKYSKGSKWSHAKPAPLSFDAPPTTQDQSSNIMTVEMANQATNYETLYPTHYIVIDIILLYPPHYINHGFEQDLAVPFSSAPEARVPHPPQSSSTTAQVSSVQAGGTLHLC